ncbi:ABC transporter ATP-binding protein [Saccharopolyspora sp. SCSIO 74807]|uniref:ABC transporter ATP-binding protein n=1 Tax=Saccharopolyspora sp. SCSIO 74807 TaxID=3118084 RepID=UPI0030CED22F
MTHAVEVRELVKRFDGGSPPAVDRLSFQVHSGEIFGLLGPNGAGKTTTVGVLTTRVLPSGGSARIGGVDVAADPVSARRKVAVVPQRVNLDRSLNARQNLTFHAAYHGVPRAERNRLADGLLERMGLADKRKARVDDLSGGQSQRLMIARALMHRPEVLFLDEPSTGLDPQARLFVHDRISELRAEGVTVLLTTHDMDEAEKLSDRVGIVDHGRLLTLDTPAALIKSLPGGGTVDAAMRADGADADKARALLTDLPRVEQVEQIAGHDDGQLRLRLYCGGEPAELLGPVARVLHEHQVPVTELSPGSATLEDVFIDLTGRELR